MRKGLGIGKGSGYYNLQYLDPYIHSLSAKGIKTIQKYKPSNLKAKQLKDEAKFYESLYERNKGIFYRGTADGKGLGFGVLGEGTYVSWDKGMAKAFATISSQQTRKEPKVESFKLKKGLKLLDAQSKTMADIKKELGVNAWDKIDDPFFSKILTEKVKELGFDGVISDDKADGIVIFDSNNLEIQHTLKARQFKRSIMWNPKTKQFIYGDESHIDLLRRAKKENINEWVRAIYDKPTNTIYVRHYFNPKSHYAEFTAKDFETSEKQQKQFIKQLKPAKGIKVRYNSTNESLRQEGFIHV